jgi:hypothetical protein
MGNYNSNGINQDINLPVTLTVNYAPLHHLADNLFDADIQILYACRYNKFRFDGRLVG